MHATSNDRALSERRFLEGPRRRRTELRRAIGIFREFIRGFRALHFVGPCVTLFGSARIGEGHPMYALVRETGRVLGAAGFGVITGGGPGLMEAANRGAREGGGLSIGCNIRLPVEQQANRYVDVAIEFEHFFVRKVMLVKYSHAFIAAPGGVGTLDEIFELITLMATHKVHDFPLVLLGRSYWKPMAEFVESRMIAQRLVEREVFSDLLITDFPFEALAHIEQRSRGRISPAEPPRPSRLLREHLADRSRPDATTFLARRS
jgi:uncharacterized protein (TIGR00730 family)